MAKESAFTSFLKPWMLNNTYGFCPQLFHCNILQIFILTTSTSLQKMFTFSLHIVWKFSHWHLVLKTLHHVHTCDVKVTWSKSKRLRRMTHEASFRTVFPAKKGTKRHSRLLVSVSMRYLRHLDDITEKWPCSLQLRRIQSNQHAC